MTAGIARDSRSTTTPSVPSTANLLQRSHEACISDYMVFPKVTASPAAPRTFHPCADSPTKVFGREGHEEGEPFSKKVSLPASFSTQTKKSPAGTGDDQNHMQGEKSFVAHHGALQGKEHKKDPLALRAARGSSNNLWQRPTFPHDVMQYHRRWRA